MEHVALLLQTEVLSSFAPLLLSHEVFFFTSAEMIASRRHITPENCRHKAFFAKVLDAKKGIFCKKSVNCSKVFPQCLNVKEVCEMLHSGRKGLKMTTYIGGKSLYIVKSRPW